MTASHHEKLARLVEELHQELAASPQVDPSLRAALETIVNDIRRLQPTAPAPEQGRAQASAGPTVQGTEPGQGGPPVQDSARGRASPPTAAAAEDQPPHHTLVERLREAADDFEGKHPNLVALIGSIIDALQGMGI